MDISVTEAIGLIRANAAATEGEGQVSTELALVVVRAYEESLSESGVVHVRSQVPGIDYDKIAEAVVARLAVVGAKLTQRPIPDGVPPVPWRVAPGGDSGFSADDRLVLDDSDFLTTPVFQDGEASPSATINAIVEAVNAYYAPAQPPTPAEAATAGYPVPDYDAADVPEVDQRPAA